MVGVDLGGSHVAAALVDRSGVLQGRVAHEDSFAEFGAETTVAQVAKAIQRALAGSSARPLGIGIAVPGHIDDAAGVVLWAPNFGEKVGGVFKYWEKVPLRAMLQHHIDLPISLGNDANLAALGEYQYGLGKGCATCLALFTIGTGIGGGVVLGGTSVSDPTGPARVLLGGNLGGGELGHMVINPLGPGCKSGEHGSLESYCGRDAIVSRAHAYLRRGRHSSIATLVDGKLDQLEPAHLTQAADLGDELSREIWAEVGYFLGVGIGNCINIFAPQIVAIGGKIAGAGEWLLGPARVSAAKVAIPSLMEHATIARAEKADDAGILGSAVLAWEAANRT